MAVTPVVDTVNVPVVAPARIVAVAGTVAEALPEESATVKPPTGAGLLIVTVPAEVPPPATEVGVSETPVTVGAVTVRVAVDAPAVIVTVLLEATATVVAVKVPVVAPVVNDAVAGTVVEASPDLSATVKLAGAGPLRVIVPVVEAPPTTLVGARVTPVTVGAATARVAV